MWLDVLMGLCAAKLHRGHVGWPGAAAHSRLASQLRTLSVETPNLLHWADHKPAHSLAGRETFPYATADKHKYIF